jgi:two-component system, NtrC family, response regulator HydG
MATILVIDDEKLVAEAIAGILRRGGHSPVVATSAREGLQRLAREAFDLVVTDLQMPDITGLEIIPALKERRPQVPVIVLSGIYGGPHVQDEAVRLGACRFMEKPMSRVTLLSAVAHCIAVAKFAGTAGG